MGLKQRIYDKVVKANPNVWREYEKYVLENISEHNTNRLKHWKVLYKLNVLYRIKRKKEILKYLKKTKREIKVDTTVKNEKNYEGTYFELLNRKSVNEMVSEIIDFDVISFDIFDTLIYRKVEKPNDIFNIMSAEMGQNDFADIRKKAEEFARKKKEKLEGTREVVLREIYDCLYERFDIEKKWMEREIELELEMSIPNNYIKQIYDKLLSFKKKIVFMTDMYLPIDVIKKLLERNGYGEYDNIFLSNQCLKRKGDGSLQEELILAYPHKKIVHIGDNYDSDCKKTIEMGIAAIHNPDSYVSYREPELENMAASIYRAVIQTNMNNGLWDKNIYYSHGYRIGGLLAVGYCNYINKIASYENIEKILFCSRDGYILHKIYKNNFDLVNNDYLKISRHAIFNVTSEHYLYDLTNRYLMRYIKMFSNSKTIATIMDECGFGYLIDKCKDYNINPYMFPTTIHDDNRIQEFLYSCSKEIYEHNSTQREAAKQYFKELIGDAKKVLVVDIGWSGTCISAFKYFLSKNLPELKVEVYGTLMFTNRDQHIKNSIQFGEIKGYINTPFDNMDITRHIFPGPPRSRDIKEMDKLHMPVEYMFTSTEKSLKSYGLDERGKYTFNYLESEVSNAEQIIDMQEGMCEFAKTYESYRASANVKVDVPPYTAFAPLKDSIGHSDYCYKVFKDFAYDAFSQINNNRVPKFEVLFEDREYNKSNNSAHSSYNGKKVLFVTPELTYSGTPRSMLRMCRAAKILGYGVTVWSSKEGDFRKEYEQEEITVEIVSEGDIEKRIKDIINYDIAVCNTVVTSKYSEIFCQFIPTIWYIREATNIPDFIKNNKEREYVIKHSKDICVVSDYAANALKPYADETIKVVHNCVEDEVAMASDYITGTGEKVKFVQFGTMEYRKGYDVLIAAYKSMPKEYQEKSEVFFAGGFIASGASYCDYIFDEISKTEGINYIGLIQGEEKKIDTLSRMDVVIVASRDESCSLVALEGTMLSKPLIVTENVGAKYMVTDDNGIIVPTADVESLKNAMMSMIDNKSKLLSMGEVSRKLYEKKASMKIYVQSMKDLFSICEKKGTPDFEKDKKRNVEVFSKEYKAAHPVRKNNILDVKERLCDTAVVSLTSHPGRMNVICDSVDSLLNQTVTPKKIVLVLSKQQFPRKEKDLPARLIAQTYTNDYFEIFWVEDDLKPHKKYFYTMKLYPDSPVIIVDDDVIYDEHLVENLLLSYEKFPDCISAMRTNLMGFKNNDTLMDYEGWIMGYRALQDIPSTILIPTGVGGVLYPPNCLPEEAFDKDAITENCLYADDIWLKIWASHVGIKVVMPENFCLEKLIDGSQEVALWKMNVRQGNNNDVSVNNTLAYYQKKTGNKKELLEWIRKDRFC